MKEPSLTAELIHKITSSIRAGSYGHVAARAWGVPPKVYRRWLRLGRAADAPEPFASFAAEVDAAQAQARLRAEAEAFKKHARAWLEHGPGREQPDDPGWTALAKPAGNAAPADVNVFELPEFMELCRRLLEALADFPEARARAAAVLLSQKHSAENSSWSAPDDGPDSKSPRGDGMAGAATAAGTTTMSPPAAPAAGPG